jgi:flavodoxin
MRSAIVYYSYTGNTHRMAQVIMDILKSKNEEIIPVRIRPLKEDTNFLAQCIGAFFSKKPELYRTLLDLKSFDRIIVGSPVWAFKPAPAINTYLNKCTPLENKEAICFVTYGSGTGKDKTLENIKKQLEVKGVRNIKTISFQQDESSAEAREKLLKLL